MSNYKQRATVLLPVFNAEKYVGEAIESVLNQSYSNFIFLIIDDGSVDNSVKVISSFKDPRIKLVLMNENSGIVAALNKGLSIINTEYIIRMDADDISLSNRFVEQISYMDANPKIGISSTPIKTFGDSESIWSVPVGNDKIKTSLLFRSPFSHPAAIIRTQVLKQNNLLYRANYPHLEDYDLWYRLKNITRFGNLDKVLYLYRKSGDNITDRHRDSFSTRQKLLYKKILADLDLLPTDQELQIHLEISRSDLPLTNSLANYYKWINKLQEKNEELEIFPQGELLRMLDQLWDKLFYRVMHKGVSSVVAHFISSGKINWNNLSIYSKFMVNRVKRKLINKV